MRIDLTPLYRSAIGFDRLASLVEGTDNQPKYPPYNVELIDENKYQILIAIAGFDESEIDITSEQNVLKIRGQKQQAEEKKYLYQGIAFRNFERKFQLADYVKVVGAQLENGMLSISLEREIPEAMKPRKISITTSSPTLNTQALKADGNEEKKVKPLDDVA